MNTFFSDMFLAAPLGLAIIDKNYTFVEVNDKFIEKTPGKKRSDYIGQTLKTVLGDTDWKDMKPYVIQALEGKVIQDVVIKNTKYEVSYYPIDTKKKNSLVGMILRDASEEIETEESLDQYKQRLEQAQKAGQVGVFDWDIKTNKIWWSEEEEALFGVPPGAFKGDFDDWMNAVHPDDRKNLRKEIDRCIKAQIDLDTEFRVIYPGNIIHWIGGRGHIYYYHDVPYRMIGVNYDITHRKHFEQLLTFKSEATRVLSSSWDYEHTLQTVTKLATESVADWCSIDILNEKTGKFILIAASHRDPKITSWAFKKSKRDPITTKHQLSLNEVFERGKTLYLPYISQKTLTEHDIQLKNNDLIRKLHAVSAMIIPLKIANKTIGAITFISAESKIYYTENDLNTAEQLASRVTLAVENTQLYETVKNERERLDDLLANVPGVVWESWGDPVTNAQKITYVSAHAERLLGYPREDWLTKQNFWLKIVHPDDQKQASEVARKNYKAGGSGISRFRWITKKGKAIWMESQSFVVKDKKGKPMGMRGIVMDISENMEQLRRKDEFLSLASHELKTPLTTIKAFNQILKNIVTKDISKEYLSKMEVQINKLTRLVSELLDVSKIHEGKLELKREPIELDQFIYETTAVLQTIIKNHTIRLKLHAPVTINGDKDRLAQVFSNIIMNGVKYSPQSNKILVESKEVDDGVEISITDFGVGIESKHHTKIFNRFYRVNNETRAPGLGIGLFISKEILTRHGGSLFLKSKPGKGSTFTIKLPIHE